VELDLMMCVFWQTANARQRLSGVWWPLLEGVVLDFWGGGGELLAASFV
jgi:hypothetical protein